MIDDYDATLMDTDYEFLQNVAKKYEDRNPAGEIANIIVPIKMKIMNLMSASGDDEIDSFMKDYVEEPLEKHFGDLIQTVDVCRTIKFYLVSLRSEMEKTKIDPEELIRLGGSEAESPIWLSRIEDFLKARADEVDALKSAASTLLAVRVDASKNEDEKAAARDAFKSAYKNIRLTELVNDFEDKRTHSAVSREQQRFSNLRSRLDNALTATQH